MTLRWGFVGRDEELELLRGALCDVGTRGVVLSGAPGVGKTRLATELLEHAADQGWATQWAVGGRGAAGVPLGAFAHLLPSGHASIGSVEVMRRVGDELRRSSGDRPIVLGVDDAHLLDEASAGLTRELACRADAFVVATVRRGERIPEAIDSLCTDGLAERVEVRALSRIEVSELLGAVLGGQLDTATRHRLWQVTRGNVRFLQELVLVGLERGALEERGGVWAWAGELTCSDRLTELVEDQLAGLSPQQRSALEVLAVGEPLPAVLFGSVVGTRLVQQLHKRGLLTLAQHARRSVLTVAHPLYAETVRAGLGAVRRRTIYRQLADALTATGLRWRQDELCASVWQLESGGPADPALLVTGSVRATAVADHPLAERLARAAIDEHGGADAWLALAEALHCQGRYQEAYSAVLECLPQGADAARVGKWARLASSIYFRGFGAADRADEIIRWAEQAMAPGPELDLLIAHRAALMFLHGRPGEAWATVEPLLARSAPDDRIGAAARVVAAPALAALGRCHTALRLADEGIKEGRRLIDERPQLLGELLAAQTTAYGTAGRYRQMEDQAGTVYRHVVAERTNDLRGLWATLLGRAALATGQVATARHRLREACALLRRHDPGGHLPWALGAAALAAALLGDVDDARRELAEQRRSRLPAVRVFEWEILLAQAWTADAQGEHSTARGLACRAADIAAAAGLCSAEVEALHDAVRLGEIRVASRLAEVAGAVDSVLAPVFAAHAAALVAGDGAALDRCATRFAELGTPLLAAEAAGEAAERYQRSGRPAARFAALGRCRVWASECEGAKTPSLRRAGGPPALDSLTTREREIAELAAHGLARREIAERLALSVRTVGNHLNHIYAKTGISGRAELALLVGPKDNAAPAVPLIVESRSVLGWPAHPLGQGPPVFGGDAPLPRRPGGARGPAHRRIGGQGVAQQPGEAGPGTVPVAQL